MINYLKRVLKSKSLLDQLKENGLKVGKNFFMNSGCKIDFSHCWLIKIGDNVTLASNVIILAHDASTKRSLDYTKIALVEIGDNVFIGAGAIVMPCVNIGDNVIVGAGSLVLNDLNSGGVYLGSPAKFYCDLKTYLANESELMNSENTFGEEYTLRNKIDANMKQEMIALNSYLNLK